MRRLNLDLADRSYPILIGPGLLARADQLSAYLPTPRIALVSNEVVAPLYRNGLVGELEKVGVGVTAIVLPDGEAHKNWESLNRIHDALLAARCDRAPQARDEP